MLCDGYAPVEQVPHDEVRLATLRELAVQEIRRRRWVKLERLGGDPAKVHNLRLTAVRPRHAAIITAVMRK